ncbi:MAG: GTP cyclohydrolase I FolE [Elusimicrobiaceae bacterium]|jgi:GTP cyclohydrolase IA|nr:GTP cyclohydrolase I FolE [Elusimicrobiaceae bacterium]MBT3954571.1 GTP cyclohydrolase I FolE [Elusimicrobiaceae bacterium]MBT4007879.1 GTP cyclohydrolase I FolE [Elusimicrobiaceae bacterium]MBT4402565.1 GTP cyclohydrolase I FolE [Elusimicrobiaceae bacterium]MBT4439893.1 GTP cyclohydrolase I FolE [Elusimicrobiaceae bacterium]
MPKNNKRKPANKVKRTASQNAEHKIEQSLKKVLAYVGDNPNREGLKETPKRMLNSYKEMFSGYKQKPESVLKTFIEGTCDEMVILKDMEFYSTCEHHFLPFFGTISIGYIPNKKIIGISKLARMADIFARRLQIQEKLCADIADSLMKHLAPQGVMVVCKAQHMCISSRGVRKNNAIMVTSALRGVFEQPEVRAEFLQFTQHK